MVLYRSTVCLILIITCAATLTVSEKDGDSSMKFAAASHQVGGDEAEDGAWKNLGVISRKGRAVTQNRSVSSTKSMPKTTTTPNNRTAAPRNRTAAMMNGTDASMKCGAVNSNPAILGGVVAAVVLGITVIIIGE
jgi:hypothetical protein